MRKLLLLTVLAVLFWPVQAKAQTSPPQTIQWQVQWEWCPEGNCDIEVVELDSYLGEYLKTTYGINTICYWYEIFESNEYTYWGPPDNTGFISDTITPFVDIGPQAFCGSTLGSADRTRKGW